MEFGQGNVAMLSSDRHKLIDLRCLQGNSTPRCGVLSAVYADGRACLYAGLLPVVALEHSEPNRRLR